jgi:formylmethanofuran dehydrogenase subunit B
LEVKRAEALMTMEAMKEVLEVAEDLDTIIEDGEGKVEDGETSFTVTEVKAEEETLGEKVRQKERATVM